VRAQFVLFLSANHRNVLKVEGSRTTVYNQKRLSRPRFHNFRPKQLLSLRIKRVDLRQRREDTIPSRRCFGAALDFPFKRAKRR
jgi:hypothetical protein